jgi:hypothetical protein
MSFYAHSRTPVHATKGMYFLVAKIRSSRYAGKQGFGLLVAARLLSRADSVGSTSFRRFRYY